MNKDVIYIDVDDDVTAIIGKIKDSKEKIVALVPPKRSGALQSAVNLRLLDRMAKADKKQLVLISNNQALMGLAASNSIPVAKNLQSKPEIAAVPALAVDEGDDIIDGGNLPVGDHADTVEVHDGTAEQGRSDAIDTIELEQDSAAAPVAVGAAAKHGKKKVKVPNFDSFRKKLFIGIGAGVALIALLIWMFVIAPAATIVITASASPAPVSTSVSLVEGGTTNYDEGELAAVSQTKTTDESIEFTATGTGKVGEEAAGSMTLTRTSVSSTPIDVPAGTTFTASGLNFVSTESTTLAGTTIGPGGVIQDSATVPVEATDVGAEYNLSARSYQASVGGFSSNGSDMTGGSSRTVKVVSSSDVTRAQGELVGRSTDDAKAELAALFTNGEKVIDDSFTVSRGDVVSTPAVGDEAADGKAKLVIKTAYTMYAVPQADLTEYLNRSLEKQIVDSNSQRIYDDGYNEAAFSNFRKQGKEITATLTATGQIGPKIDEAAIKDQSKGKKYGEVQSDLESIDGIQEVDVRFSYFWVATVPNNTDKIQIEFKLQNE